MSYSRSDKLLGSFELRVLSHEFNEGLAFELFS